MCGIAGYINLNKTPVDPELLRNMACALSHRGPDDEGFYRDESLGFVHRRLSVIDLSGGRQPMSSPDGEFTVIFNGEIFNYKELRKSLKQYGETFHTESDTEVLIPLFRKDGTDFLNRLNGFFAFALYDKQNQRLLLARDRLGQKPLYYFKTETRFAFASELSALKQLPDMPRELSSEAIGGYLSCQYIHAPRTIYRNVFKLPPGHFLMLDLKTGNGEPQRYWNADFSRKTELPYSEAANQLRGLLSDSVEKRLNADVPVGIFLSGGMDSAIIAGLAATFSGTPLQCFSIGFNDPVYDERDSAQRTFQHLKQFAKHEPAHHIKVVDPCDFDILKMLSIHFGEPYADASMLPMYLLSRFTREHVTVALGGDGADELFCGYERYLAMKYLRKLNHLPSVLRKGLLKLLRNGGNERSFSARLRRLLNAAGLNPVAAYAGIQSRQAEIAAKLICKKEFLHHIHYPEPPEFTTPEADERWTEWDIHSYLPGDILPKADISSMAASLELRSPFLDSRVAEFAFSLPSEYKQKGNLRKRILGDAFRDLLPSGLAGQRKKGFGVPLASWFREPWRELMTGHLLEGSLFRELDYFQRAPLESLIGEHCSGKRDHSYILFSLLMLELFFSAAKK